jgi:hypothetical protein
MNTNIPDTFETVNDSNEESMIINGLRLRVNPTDIQVFADKNPEIVPMMRSAKSYVYASQHVKGKINIWIAFDGTNEIDTSNLISLCAYMDLYPFIFIKSDRLKKYVRHTYQGIFDYQIYGVHSYSLQANSELQGVYILTLELEYFNYNPLAKSLFFYNIKTETTTAINPMTGVNETTDNSSRVAEIDPASSEIFQEYFQQEIVQRKLNYAGLITDLKKGPSFFSFKVPYFFQVDNPKSLQKDVDNGIFEKVVTTKIKSDVEMTTALNSKTPSPTEEDIWFIRWVDIINPATRTNNLNDAVSLIQSMTITKRNMIASLSMAAYPYPVLQYMGKGQVDVFIEMENNSAKVEDKTTYELIKSAFSMVDYNFHILKQAAVYNVIKIDSPLTCIAPVYGVVSIGDKIVASSATQGKETFSMYLMEQDNREILKRSKYNSSGAQIGADLDLIISDFKKAQAYIDQATPKIITAPIGAGHQVRRPQIPPSLTQADIDQLYSLEKQYNLPTGLLYGLMMTESKGNPLAISPTGAKGAFQFTPGAEKDFGVTDPFNFSQSAIGAAKFLAHNLKTFPDNLPYAIAGYNAGVGNVKHFGGDPIAKTGVFDPNRKNSKKGTRGETLQHYNNTIKYMQQAVYGVVEDIANTNNKQSTDTYREALKTLCEQIGKNVSQSLSNEGVFGEFSDAVITSLGLGSTFFIDYYDSFKNSLTQYPVIKTTNKLPPFDAIYQDGYIKLYQLAANGNPYASAIIQGSGKQFTDLTDALQDKFRDEGVPDLNFTKNFSTTFLNKMRIKDPRIIPPFFFLAQQSYFNMKDVSAVLDVVSTAAIDPNTQQNILNKEIHSLLTGLDKGDQNTNYKLGINLEIPTDFSQGIKLATDVFTLGTNKTVLDETTQGDVYTQPGKKIDPFNPQDIINQQKISITSYFKNGINIAFPVLKVYMVDGDETTFINQIIDTKHNYYEISGIIDARLATNNDDNPMDVMQITLANPGSVYTDSSTLHDKFKVERVFENLGTEEENKFVINNIIIQAGTRLHIRAGYGNNPNEMEVMFNGIVTEIGGEHVITIVAEGFGRELVLYKHGDNPNSNAFIGNANTKSILANAINSEEIEHFGEYKLFGSSDADAKRLFTLSSGGVFNFFKYSNKNINIWLDSIGKLDDEYSASFLSFGNFFTIGYKAWYQYPIYKMTPWDMLKEMEYRHPGTFSKPVWYDDRSSFFFGQREQLYIYRSLPSGVSEGHGKAVIDDVLVGALTGAIVGGALGALVGGFAGGFAGLFNYDGGALYQEIRNKRFKPVCDMHIATSEHNIITNRIRTSNKFNTVINVQYYGDVDQIKDRKFDNYIIKVDDNLRPSAHRQGDLALPGCNGKVSAVRYGSVELRREMEKMYDGELILIGNPRIKSGDFIAVNDHFRKMQGIIKVRECVHEWSLEQGYTTVVTPGLFVETSFVQYPLSSVFPLLYTGCYALSEVNCDAASRNFATDKDFLNDSFLINNPIIVNDKTIEDITTRLDNNKSFDWLNSIWPAANTVAGTEFVISVTSNLLGSSLKQVAANTAVGINSQNIVAGINFLKNTTTGAFNAIRGLASAVVEDGLVSTSFLRETAIVAGRSLLWGSRLAFANPLGIAVGLLAYNIYASVALNQKGRQPVRIYPLLQNNLQYVAGIYGYKENSLYDSIKDNIMTTAYDFGIILKTLQASFNTGTR